MNKTTLVCQFCGIEFQRSEVEAKRIGRYKTGPFCSPTCANHSRRCKKVVTEYFRKIEHECPICHKVYSKPPSIKGECCSPKCAGLFKKKTLVERFWQKVEKSNDIDGCWIWTASFYPDGYGQIKDGVKNCRASRVSYELNIGPIPTGLFVCHRCDNPKCVRPDHLFLGTPQDNMQDMVKKGRHAEQKVSS